MPHQLAFERTVASAQGELRALMDQWRSGALDVDSFGDEIYDVLRRRHADAYELGLRQAGSHLDPLARRTLAEQHGRQAADAEMDFLDGFLADLESGRYEDDEGEPRLGQIGARLDMYAHKLRGTAGQAFVDGSPEDSTFEWRLGAAEHHCQDCPRMAALGPYTADELFTTPGQGDTECLTGCQCHLERQDGVRSFVRP